mgnify:CR=1 FL=1
MQRAFFERLVHGNDDPVFAGEPSVLPRELEVAAFLAYFLPAVPFKSANECRAGELGQLGHTVICTPGRGLRIAGCFGKVSGDTSPGRHLPSTDASPL